MKTYLFSAKNRGAMSLYLGASHLLNPQVSNESCIDLGTASIRKVSQRADGREKKWPLVTIIFIKFLLVVMMMVKMMMLMMIVKMIHDYNDIDVVAVVVLSVEFRSFWWRIVSFINFRTSFFIFWLLEPNHI